MARRSHGVFTPSFLEDVERGRVTPDERTVSNLVGLYEVEAGPVVPERSQLVLDLDRHELIVDGSSMPFDSLHTDDVLGGYVSLIYQLRGLEPGSDLVLRDRDLAVLSQSLGVADEELRREIRGLIDAPDSVRLAKAVGWGRVLAAAGLITGVTVLGVAVLLGGTSGDRSSTASAEVLGAQQVQLSAADGATGSATPAELGAAASQLIAYDYRTALPDWEISFAPDSPDFLGVTRSADKSITIHVEPDATPELVAAVLMHEVGHAIDLEHMTDRDRAEWIALRGMPSTWWPGNGLSDFAVGAGDFAEAVSAYTTGSASSSTYGEFTGEQLAFVADILARG